jgi:hypothetical protein
MDARTTDRCATILKKLRELPLAAPFLHPVSETTFPEYRRLVTTPMDLSTMRKLLKHNKYRSFNEWERDLEQISKNAAKANGPTHPVAASARQLLCQYRKLKKVYFESNTIEQLTEQYCALCLKLEGILSEPPPNKQLEVFSAFKEEPQKRGNAELMTALSQIKSKDDELELLFLIRELEARTEFEGTNEIVVNLGELKPETIVKLNEFVSRKAGT